jgi:hypothetical protein
MSRASRCGGRAGGSPGGGWGAVAGGVRSDLDPTAPTRPGARPGRPLRSASVNRLKGWRQVLHSGGMLLLVPSDPLRPRRADEHFVAEAAAARDAGVTVGLIDHDTLADCGEAERALASVPDSVGRPSTVAGCGP